MQEGEAAQFSTATPAGGPSIQVTGIQAEQADATASRSAPKSQGCHLQLSIVPVLRSASLPAQLAQVVHACMHATAALQLSQRTGCCATQERAVEVHDDFSAARSDEWPTWPADGGYAASCWRWSCLAHSSQGVSKQVFSAQQSLL